jgi:hypothetical protein
MPTALWIDGADMTDHLLDGTLSVDYQIGGRAMARFTIIDRFDTGYRPAIRESVYVIRDEVATTGSMTSASKTLTTAAPTFTATDVGKIVQLQSAGPLGAELHARISDFNSTTSVQLNRTAKATVSGTALRFGWRHFAGVVSAVGESTCVDDVGLLTVVSAVDFSQILDRRLVQETYPAGFTHNNLLNDIGVNYLDSNGLYVDEEIQPADQLPELIFDLVTAREVCDTVSEMLGLIYYVDECPLLYMLGAGINPTPVSLDMSNSTVLLGSTSDATFDQYRNRQYLRYGSGTREVTLTLTGNGSQREWVLDYIPQSKPEQVYDPNVTPDPAWKHVGVAGVDTLFEWVYDSATHTLEQLTEAPPGTSIPALGVGDFVTVTFVAVFPQTVMSDDAVEIVAFGDWDAVDERPDIFDPTAAQQACDALLRKGMRSPWRPKVTTFEHGFRPGQIGAISGDVPAASGDYLIEDVHAELGAHTPRAGGSDFQTWRYQINAVEGDEPQSTWLDWWRGGRGGSSAASGTITVGTPPTPPSGGGGAGGGPWIAFLGGADPERRWTALASGTWFDVPWHVDLVLNGDSAGSVAAVRIHLIVPAGGMTIQPRLYNTSASTVAGTGTAVTPTSFTYQAFYVTLTPGVNVYRLQFNVSSTAIEYGYWQAICDNQG